MTTNAVTAAAPSATPSTVASAASGTSSSLSADSVSTSTRIGRITASGARDDTCAPMITPGDAAEQQGAGERELELAPDQVTDGGREHEWHRLHQVGPDQLLAREHRVQEHQRHDHERTGPD